MRLQRLNANDFTTLKIRVCAHSSLSGQKPALCPHHEDTGDNAAGCNNATPFAPGFGASMGGRAGHGDAVAGNGKTALVKTGDVIRTPPNEIHGLTNTVIEPFVYMTATTPPVDLTTSYGNAKSET